MATLASQLATDYALLVVDPQFDETNVTRVSQLAAARMERYGAGDGDDTAAVDLGLEYMTLLISKRFNLIADEDYRQALERWRADAEDFRDSRIQEAAAPIAYDAEGEAIE